ncbi:MAG: DUF2188 domain-containing protein [Steroidobacteraceae bacterium]
MTPAQYYVVNRSGAWKIKFRDDLFGPYLNQAEALRLAIDAAQNLGRRGTKSQVLIEGEPDHFHAEWTFGQNPYPPHWA